MADVSGRNGSPGQAGAASAGEPPTNVDKTIAAVLGEMSQSSEFKQYLISDLEWLMMPPILLRQFKLFYHEGKPVAVVLYAKVSDEVAARLDAGAPTLRSQDWKSGETVKVVKVIAPFGGGDEFSEGIRRAIEFGTKTKLM